MGTDPLKERKGCPDLWKTPVTLNVGLYTVWVTMRVSILNADASNVNILATMVFTHMVSRQKIKNVTPYGFTPKKFQLSQRHRGETNFSNPKFRIEIHNGLRRVTF